jgi:hypothetical protein
VPSEMGFDSTGILRRFQRQAVYTYVFGLVADRGKLRSKAPIHKDKS